MSTQSDKVNNGALFTLTAVGASALVAIYFGVTALVRHQASTISANRHAGSDQEVQDLRAGWDKQQSAPPHRDPKRGTIALPIDVAMGAVVTDLKRDPRTATAYLPPDAGAAGAGAEGEQALAGEEGSETTEETPKPAPTPAETAPEPKEPEKKPQDPEKKNPGTLGGVVAPRQPPAPVPAAPAPVPAPAPAPAPAPTSAPNPGPVAPAPAPAPAPVEGTPD